VRKRISGSRFNNPPRFIRNWHSPTGGSNSGGFTLRVHLDDIDEATDDPTEHCRLIDLFELARRVGEHSVAVGEEMFGLG